MAGTVRIPGLDALTPATIPGPGWLFPMWNPVDDTTYKVDLYMDLGLALFTEFPTPANHFKPGQPPFATAAEAVDWMLSNWGGGSGGGGVTRSYRTLAQADDLINNSKVSPGQPYLIDFGAAAPSIYSRMVLLDGGEDSDNFARIGELIVNGQSQGLVTANIGAGTLVPYVPKTYSSPGQNTDGAMTQKAATDALMGTRNGTILFGTGAGERVSATLGFQVRIAFNTWALLGAGVIGDFQFSLYKNQGTLVATYNTFGDLNVGVGGLTPAECVAGYYIVAKYNGNATSVVVNFKAVTL